ncbi:hypothetical protein C2S53_006645 [Perilla frutescens var. hirtella]|uniref:Pollen Ole e 1 allergen and extensin family protein n=1 Tax=Perilla frutescens var. hirtella TaxID=608512 RepID=A0AAD4J7J0_PERFH|nr:hypothetical protein C2S53_006645 [Perilla frutescens var. hirtella]
MAYNSAASALFLAALLLFTAASPSAQVAAAGLNGLTVSGRLCCATNGNCPGQGVAGAAVLLNCTLLGQIATVGIAITDANGAYNITIPALPGLILGLPIVPCVVGVRLPLGAVVCPVLSTTTGVLAGTLHVVGTVVNAVLGLVQSATVDLFVLVGV